MVVRVTSLTMEKPDRKSHRFCQKGQFSIQAIERTPAMARCVKCGADTILFVNGTPICTKCDDEENKGKAKEEFEGKRPRREYEERV